VRKYICTIDTFTSYENRDEVRTKTYIEIKYRSESIVYTSYINGLNIITTSRLLDYSKLDKFGHFFNGLVLGFTFPTRIDHSGTRQVMFSNVYCTRN
jgi:hypothetical protein